MPQNKNRKLVDVVRTAVLYNLRRSKNNGGFLVYSNKVKLIILQFWFDV